MQSPQINAVRSRPIDADELTITVDRVQAHTRRHDLVRHLDREIHCFPLKVHGLPKLDAFERIFDVTLSATSHDSCDYHRFRSLTRLTHAYSEGHAWTTSYVSESAEANATKKEDLSVLAGLRKEGYFSGVQLFRPSPAVSSISYRRALFDQAIMQMGVSHNVVTQIGDGVLYMGAMEPWKLVYPSHEISGGGNPLGFFVCGFSGIEEALSAGERLLADFAKTKLSACFVTRLPGDAYYVLFNALSELWNLWEIAVMGSLTPEATDILKGGDVSSTSPSRIPAFEWYGAKGWAAYGSVVIEDGQRFLEIATEGVTPERLQERIAFLGNLKFEIISDNTFLGSE
jgi:hypothetical protein